MQCILKARMDVCVLHLLNFADKPECSILQGDYEGQIMLTCEAKSNPAEVVFGWTRGGNQSMQLDDFSVEGLKSILTLDASQEHFGTYYCQANNSLGAGMPCEIEVQGVGLLKTMGGANIIIIVAVIAASIVAVLVVIVVVILICRRRNVAEKCKHATLLVVVAMKQSQGHK